MAEFVVFELFLTDLENEKFVVDYIFYIVLRTASQSSQYGARRKLF
jgi:hypothetical protein